LPFNELNDILAIIFFDNLKIKIPDTRSKFFKIPDILQTFPDKIEIPDIFSGCNNPERGKIFPKI